MQTRNPIFNHHGTIDCEINHSIFGWVPFTASPNDVEPHGREIFEALKDSAAPYVPVSPPPPTREEQESKRHAAYMKEADPLFFEWQAGEGTEQAWLEKREEIRLRYPYPAESETT